jgi:hypothetical protein
MSVVFQIGSSDFPAKEYYLDEIWTELKKAKDTIVSCLGNNIEWDLVTGQNECPVWRGTYTKKGNPFKSFVWIKPVVLNTPEYNQRFALQNEKWNNPKLFK